ncbi:phosphoribosyltransferase [Collimonas arenae]|nr:phosphoribosyltransferase family protein [Collimonas arenae]
MLKIFANRTEAAQMLAHDLHEYKGRNPLILAIPRGAVPMGKVLAQRLDGELDIVLVHKLGAPFHQECAIGAIDETGWVYINSFADEAGGTGAFLEEEKHRQLLLLRERRLRFTPHQQAIDPRGRIAIVIDDGMASGATMIAALHTVRARQPAELICAVPVAAPESLEQVRPLADRIFCLLAPTGFFAVGQFYRDFRQVEDEEVIALLSRNHKDEKSGTHP